MCTICQVSETSRALPQSNNASLSLTIDSKQALFSVRNTTQGIIISITPLCSNASCSTPEAITIDNVFLPAECSLAACDSHMLVKKEMLNESSVVQYLIGVPANQSMLLLRFIYETTLQLFEMVERVVTNQGISDCSPTSVVQLNKQYYTLCVNQVEHNFQVLRIDSLDDLSQASFNPITDKPIHMALPITAISVLDYIQFDIVRLLLANGPILTIVSVELFVKISYPITECVGIIHQLKLRNNSFIDIYPTIPYLIYCETNYVVLDTRSSDDPIAHYYNETGYPVICTNEIGSIVAEIAINKSDFNRTIHYRGMTIIIPGQEIDLEKSICFGVEEKLFYLYSDSILGAVFVNLETGNWTFLSSLSAIRTNPQVFDNRYVLLEEVFSGSNVTLRLFDVLVQEFVSVVNMDHASNFVQLLQLPQQKPAEEGLTTVYVILIGVFSSIILLLIGLVAVTITVRQ